MEIYTNKISAQTIDSALSYIPVVSTGKGLYDLFSKKLIIPRMNQNEIQNHKYYAIIAKKSTLESLLILVPLIGNIALAIINKIKRINASHIHAIPAEPKPVTKSDASTETDEVESKQVKSNGTGTESPTFVDASVDPVLIQKKSVGVDANQSFGSPFLAEPKPVTKGDASTETDEMDPKQVKSKGTGTESPTFVDASVDPVLILEESVEVDENETINSFVPLSNDSERLFNEASITSDPKFAIQLHLRAWRLGCQNSVVPLASFIYSNDLLGISDSELIDLLKQASENGVVCAKYTLANHYKSGKKCLLDIDKANELFLQVVKAVDSGDQTIRREDYCNALLRIGGYYLNKQPPTPQAFENAIENAIRYTVLAGQEGSHKAILNLAIAAKNLDLDRIVETIVGQAGGEKIKAVIDKNRLIKDIVHLPNRDIKRPQLLHKIFLDLAKEFGENDSKLWFHLATSYLTTFKNNSTDTHFKQALECCNEFKEVMKRHPADDDHVIAEEMAGIEIICRNELRKRSLGLFSPTPSHHSGNGSPHP